jgi:hypothetical protein
MSNEGLNLPEIDINLEGEDVRAWGGNSGPKLPIGTYTMDIVKAEQDVGKTSNQPVAVVTFRVADEGENNGVELTKKYSLQPKALGRMKNLMIACGARLDKIRLGELMGSRLLVDIVHVEGKGTVNAQGEPVPGGTFCDVTNETGIAAPEPAPAPPPAAKAAAAAKPAAAPAAAAKPNGAPAARRA